MYPLDVLATNRSIGVGFFYCRIYNFNAAKVPSHCHFEFVGWGRDGRIFEALGKDAMQCGGEGGLWWLGLNLLAAGNVEMQLAVRNLPLPPHQPLHKPPLEPPTASYEPNPVPVERPSDHEQPWKGKKRGRRNFQTADTFKSCWFKDLEFSNPWWHTNKEHLTTSSVPEEEKLRNKLVPMVNYRQSIFIYNSKLRYLLCIHPAVDRASKKELGFVSLDLRLYLK